MRIKGNGLVGIGTDNPAYKLEVKTLAESYGISHIDGNVKISTWVGEGGEIGTLSNHAFSLFAFNGDNQFGYIRIVTLV